MGKRVKAGFVYVAVLAVIAVPLVNIAFVTPAGAATATTSALAPTTCATGARRPWATPANATTNNSTYTSVTLKAATSAKLTCTGFGFSIPAGATITGFSVTAGRYASAATSITDGYISLVRGGTVITTTTPTLSVKPTSATSGWATAKTADVYGSTASDKWGYANWLPSDVNASNFGVELTAKTTKNSNITAYVDYFTITVAYTYPLLNGSGYQWYTNADSATLTTPLGGVAQNTAGTTLYNKALFRLRTLVHVSDVTASTGAYSFKLQYALKGAGSCIGTESYTDVTTTTPIAYADNPSLADGQTPVASTYPTNGSNTIVPQEYNEANNTSIVAAVAAGQDALFDFALKDVAAQYGAVYCLRIANSDGTALNGGYTAGTVPTLITPAGITSIDFVDSGNVSVTPQFLMQAVTAGSTCQNATGAIGVLSGARLRITQNGNAGANGWHIDVAADMGATASWSDGSGHSYDFNDTSGSGCNVGSDGDSIAGLMSFIPSNGTVTGLNACSTTGIAFPGGTFSFANGTNTAIPLVTSTNASAANCSWDISGVGVSQTIPSSQFPGDYSIFLTLTQVTS